MNTVLLEKPSSDEGIGENLDVKASTATLANRRIGKRERPFDHNEEEVLSFVNYLGQSWQSLTEELEGIEDEFENWNKWFKKEKKHPPEPDQNKVLYLREEFNNKRSPHLWKSNPNRKWILAFGENPINNMVSSVLYKYQNETISKDA